MALTTVKPQFMQSWEAASRADSGDSGWDSVGQLGGPQGSWEWLGSRSSAGSGGLPSHLRPVDDAVIAEVGSVHVKHCETLSGDSLANIT